MESDYAKLEFDVQQRLQKLLKCGHAKCPVGVIDILTDEAIIEIKRWTLWKHGMGQLLAYHIFYPDRMMRLHLFGGSPNIKTKMQIMSICCLLYTSPSPRD